ncbi:uncharacterized protein LOC143035876 [Oratosquilla oratoria]|uniref:uncharacterized protein LOC143035876 n=1 Tax=Oratosquilla oratoria TaxID=337810 RepID=UPI003F771F01
MLLTSPPYNRAVCEGGGRMPPYRHHALGGSDHTTPTRPLPLPPPPSSLDHGRSHAHVTPTTHHLQPFSTPWLSQVARLAPTRTPETLGLTSSRPPDPPSMVPSPRGPGPADYYSYMGLAAHRPFHYSMIPHAHYLPPPCDRSLPPPPPPPHPGSHYPPADPRGHSGRGGAAASTSQGLATPPEALPPPGLPWDGPNGRDISMASHSHALGSHGGVPGDDTIPHGRSGGPREPSPKRRALEGPRASVHFSHPLSESLYSGLTKPPPPPPHTSSSSSSSSTPSTSSSSLSSSSHAHSSSKCEASSHEFSQRYASSPSSPFNHPSSGSIAKSSVSSSSSFSSSGEEKTSRGGGSAAGEVKKERPSDTASSSSSSRNAKSNAQEEEQEPPARPDSPYYAHFRKGALVAVGGDVRRIEDLNTRDFVEAAQASPDLTLDPSIVSAITPARTNFSTITFTFQPKNTQVAVDASNDHPFFVLERGWSSCNPDLTLRKYQLQVRQLVVGDRCVSLTKRSPTPTPTPAPSSSTTTSISTTSTTDTTPPTTATSPASPPPPPPPPPQPQPPATAAAAAAAPAPAPAPPATATTPPSSVPASSKDSSSTSSSGAAAAAAAVAAGSVSPPLPPTSTADTVEAKPQQPSTSADRGLLPRTAERQLSSDDGRSSAKPTREASQENSPHDPGHPGSNGDPSRRRRWSDPGYNNV